MSFVICFIIGGWLGSFVMLFAQAIGILNNRNEGEGNDRSL